MKYLEAVSCKQLLLKATLAAIIINVFCYIITLLATSNFTFPLDRGWMAMVVVFGLQLFLCFILGLVIRRKNRKILFQEPEVRKRYATNTFWGLVISFIVFAAPDIISVPYYYLTMAVYRVTGLDRIVTVFDFMSIFVCWGVVFFFKVRELQTAE